MNSSVNFRRIGFWPDYSQDNPYQRLFYDSLRPYGFESTSDVSFNLDWLKDHGDKFDVVHIHWPEKLWNSDHRVVGQLRLIKARYEFLRECKRRGIVRVWTLHNWTPHFNGSWIDRVGNLMIAMQSDLILVHSKAIQDKVRRRWWLGDRTIVMPQGNYSGVYPQPRDSSLVRNELGFSNDQPLCCMLGHLRENKGIANVVAAARRLGEHFQWLVAGHVDDPSTASLLDAWRSECENVRVIDHRIDDQQFADFSNAADCFLLPYYRSSGSGALLAAISLGCAVVASDLPVFREVFGGETDAVVFVKPGDSYSLATGIKQFFGVDVATRHRAARTVSERFDWTRVIEPVAQRLLHEVHLRLEST